MVHSVVTVLSIPSVGHIGELCKSGWTNEVRKMSFWMWTLWTQTTMHFMGAQKATDSPQEGAFWRSYLCMSRLAWGQYSQRYSQGGCSEVASSVVTRHLSLTVQYIHLSIKQLLTEQRSYFFVCAYVLEQNSVFSALVSRHRDSAQTQNNTQNRPL